MGLVDYRGGDSPGKNLSLPEKKSHDVFLSQLPVTTEESCGVQYFSLKSLKLSSPLNSLSRQSLHIREGTATISNCELRRRYDWIYHRGCGKK